MPQNPLTASSVAKAVEELGAALPLQQQKRVIIPQPAEVEQHIISGIISGDGTVATKSPSSHLETEAKDQAGVSEEKCRDAVFPPAIVQSKANGAGRPPPPLLHPTTQAILPNGRSPRPTEMTPLISWGCAGGVQVQQQKQTTSQLLHFLRAKAKNVDALIVTVMDRNSVGTYGPSMHPYSMLASVKPPGDQFTSVVSDEQTAPKMLSADLEKQAPIFRIKRVESGGSLTYTCVIATETELWDLGDITTQVVDGDSEAVPLENRDCLNPAFPVEDCEHLQQNSPATCTETEYVANSGASTPVLNSITIPEFQFRRFEETEVVVSHIVDPGNFYVQLADSAVKLQALVTE